MIGLMADFEHSLMCERTRDGVKAGQQRGKFGCKPKLTPEQIVRPEIVRAGQRRQDFPTYSESTAQLFIAR